MGQSNCPFLGTKTVVFCKAYPKKMIPIDQHASSTCLCSSEDYQKCDFYKDLSRGESKLEVIEGFMLRSDYYYHPRHLWVSLSDERLGQVRIGIDDFAQKLIGPIDLISPIAEDTLVKERNSCFVVHAGNRSVELVAPISGTILEVNKQVISDPSMVNHDPYGEGWLLQLNLESDGMKSLFYGSCAKKWLEWEGERLHRMFSSDLGITCADGGETVSNISANMSDAQWARVLSQFLG